MLIWGRLVRSEQQLCVQRSLLDRAGLSVRMVDVGDNVDAEFLTLVVHEHVRCMSGRLLSAERLD